MASYLFIAFWMIGLSIVFLLLTRLNWMAPSVITPISFGLCALMGLYNWFKYHYSLSFETVTLIILLTTVFSGVAFMVSSRSPQGVRTGLSYYHSPREKSELEQIQLKRFLLLFCIIFSALTLVLYYRNLRFSQSSFGAFQDWSQAMSKRRLSVSLDMGDSGIPGYVNLFFKIDTAISFCMMYVAVNNLFSKGSKLEVAIYGVPVLLHGTAELLTGGRMGLIRMAAGLLLIVWVTWNRSHGWTRTIPPVTVFKFVLAVCAAGIVFWALGPVVGRSVEGGPLDYLASYMGYSFVALDHFLKEGLSNAPNIIGAETFTGFYNSIGRQLGITEFQYTYHLPWIYISGKSIGNVYTAYRYWLHDFGIAGAIVMAVVYAFVYSKLYNIACTNNKLINTSLIVYSYIFYGALLLPVRDCLFAAELVPTTLFIICIIALFSKCIDKRIIGWVDHGSQ